MNRARRPHDDPGTLAERVRAPQRPRLRLLGREARPAAGPGTDATALEATHETQASPRQRLDLARGLVIGVLVALVGFWVPLGTLIWLLSR